MHKYLSVFVFSMCFLCFDQVHASRQVEGAEVEEIETPLKKPQGHFKKNFQNKPAQEAVTGAPTFKPQKSPQEELSDIQIKIHDPQLSIKREHATSLDKNLSSLEAEYAQEVDLAFFKFAYAGKRVLGAVSSLCSSGAGTLSALSLMPWFETDTKTTLQGVATFLAFLAAGTSFKKNYEDTKNEKKMRQSLKKKTVMIKNSSPETALNNA